MDKKLAATAATAEAAFAHLDSIDEFSVTAPDVDSAHIFPDFASVHAVPNVADVLVVPILSQWKIPLKLLLY